MPSTMTCTPQPAPAPAPAGLLLDVDLTAGRVRLTGELDQATCGHLAAACRMLIAAGPPIWVLDVTALEFCDTAGLHALLATRRAAVDTGGALVVVGARSSLRQLLELTGLGDLLAPVARASSGPGVEGTARAEGVPATATGRG